MYIRYHDNYYYIILYYYHYHYYYNNYYYYYFVLACVSIMFLIRNLDACGLVRLTRVFETVSKGTLFRHLLNIKRRLRRSIHDLPSCEVNRAFSNDFLTTTSSKRGYFKRTIYLHIRRMNVDTLIRFQSKDVWVFERFKDFCKFDLSILGSRSKFKESASK